MGGIFSPQSTLKKEIMVYSVREKTPTTLDSSFISILEAKNFLKVSGNSATEDTRISNLIKASRQEIENRINRVILTSTWVHRINTFPVDKIQLLKVPVASVVSVKYYDTSEVQQTLTVTTNYLVDIYTARIGTPNSYSWPATQTDRMDAVEVEFIAGDAVANVPPALKNAVLYKLWENYHGDPMDSLIEASCGFYRNWAL